MQKGMENPHAPTHTYRAQLCIVNSEKDSYKEQVGPKDRGENSTEELVCIRRSLDLGDGDLLPHFNTHSRKNTIK